MMITGRRYRLIPLMCLIVLGIVSCGGLLSRDEPVQAVAGSGYLNVKESFFITQSDAGGSNTSGDQFGAAVFPGDLNGDGFEDVVVGSPGEDGGKGAVFVFSGSEAGATRDGTSITQSDAPGEVGQAGDRFGAALTSGDFNGDKIEDLVVGAPGKAPNGGPKSGAVFVFLGTATGFDPGFLLTQTDASEVNEEGDQFGAALATGDFDGDGFDELVIGAPGKAPNGGPKSGAVFVFSGSDAGFTPGSLLTQTDAGGVNEEGDRFGASLESAHFNGTLGVDIGDGFGDLAVGAPGKAPNGGPRSGAVFVFLGSKIGFTPGFMLTQTDSLGFAGCAPPSCVTGVNEEGDQFSEDLGVGDLNGDGVEELIVGAPGKSGSGTVFIFPGSPKIARGLSTGYYITQGNAGHGNGRGDRFGASIAAGVLNQDDFEELVVGAPGKGGGAVFVFPGVQGETGTTKGFLISQTDAGGMDEAGDQFGAFVAIEDFNDNNAADLAVGAPNDSKSGAVYIFTGIPISPPVITGEDACTTVGGVVGGKLVRACEVNNGEGDQFGMAQVTGDFNGDGFTDLAIGTPGKMAPSGGQDSGVVFIFPGSGSPTGLTKGFFITQTDAGGLNQAGDQFGTALAAGDFNSDGFTDLAVGAPGKGGSGAVLIFPGSAKGLTCLARFPCPTTNITGSYITQTDAGGLNQAGDQFGAALAVGDFNGDGIEDLAVGAPSDGLGAVEAGSVFVFPGSISAGRGITTGSMLTQTDAGEVNEDGDQFGAALAAGDIVGDLFQELLVGAPGKAPGGGPKAGAVFIFPGSANGFAIGSMLIQTDVGEVNEAGDQFGAALAVGDFDGDRLRDLAVGAPGDAPGAVKSGSVFIFTGSDAEITAEPVLVITHADQTDPEDVLPDEAGDQFGAALAVGEFNGNLFDELLVGAPGKATPETLPEASGGTVCVFPGSEDGITTGVFFTQKGGGGFAEDGDQFGATLTVGDFNSDLLDDLTVGAPGEALGADPKSGAVFVVGYGEINFILR